MLEDFFVAVIGNLAPKKILLSIYMSNILCKRTFRIQKTYNQTCKKNKHGVIIFTQAETYVKKHDDIHLREQVHIYI